MPAEGGALIVANHSGTVPVDALMTVVATHDHHPAQRHLRMLAADLVFTMPVFGPIARKAGHTLACNEDAERLLAAGELVGVWPEGFKGIGKPFTERYKLQRFGRGGFVSAALRTGVPIIPCSIVGAEEIYPLIGNLDRSPGCSGCPTSRSRRRSRCSGRSAWCRCRRSGSSSSASRSTPTSSRPAAADDPMLVFNLTDQVREIIQQTLYRLLSGRRNAFLG